jgi:hypothetical protein
MALPPPGRHVLHAIEDGVLAIGAGKMQTCCLARCQYCDSYRDVYRRVEEEERDAMRMHEIDIQDYARQLLEAHGDRAVAEAAQKARAFEKEGNKDDADAWRHIERALLIMRGPHAS